MRNDPPTEMTHEEYLTRFPPKVREEALKQALDIRKFEIELYWKRGTYFWTLIGAAFAGFVILEKEHQFFASHLVTCLGFLFSLAWYLVNRGSSAWQRNWEAHVDLLEDDITGPLYKTVLEIGHYRLRDVSGAYWFSPSRVNSILSLAMLMVWIILLTRSQLHFSNTTPDRPAGLALTIGAVLTATMLFWSAKRPWTATEKRIGARLRSYR
jgi:hypothetical protein